MRDMIRQKGKESSKKVGEKGFHGLRLKCSLIPQAQLQVTPMSVNLCTVFNAEHFQNVQTNQVLYSRVPVISELIHLFRMIRQANIS